MKSRREFFGNAAGMAAVGAGALVATERSAYATVPSNYPFYNVKDFGAVGDGSTDDTASIQNAVDTAATGGGVVYFPPGTYLISHGISIRNWVALKGEGRGSQILASPSFADQQMIYAANGTSSMFYSRLDDLRLNANNVAAIVGAFMLSASGISAAGASASKPLSSAILMEGDSLIADTVHVEFCTNGIQLTGIGNSNIRGVTGSSEAVGDLVVLGSNLSGSVVMQTINPNGASHAYVNNKTGATVATTVAHLVVQQ